MLEKILKTLAGHIPGTGANLAQRKREFEKRLRAEGYSRKQALEMTNKYFILK